MNNINSNSSGDGNILVQTSTSTTNRSGRRGGNSSALKSSSSAVGRQSRVGRVGKMVSDPWSGTTDGFSAKGSGTPVVRPGPLRYWHYRSYRCVMVLAMLLLVLPAWYENAQMQEVFSSITKQQQSQPRYYQQEEDALASSMAVVHVLFGLSGNAPGFLAEFEVALKSVVLNAPLDRALTISIMADQQAYQALPTIFARTGLLVQAGNAMNTTTTTTTPAALPWRTRNPITIQTYDVTSYLSDWKQRIDTVFNFTGSPYGKHTIGCFFRLFAHHVLVPQQQHADSTATAAVQHVLYLDTDVVLVRHYCIGIVIELLFHILV